MINLKVVALSGDFRRYRIDMMIYVTMKLVRAMRSKASNKQNPEIPTARQSQRISGFKRLACYE